MANEYLDKTGLTHFWDNIKGEIGNASDAQVDSWLDRHPEATTTVQDGAISTAKLADGAVITSKIANDTVTDAKLAQSGGVLEEVSNLKDDFNYAISQAINLMDEVEKYTHKLYGNMTQTLNDNDTADAFGIITVKAGKTYWYKQLWANFCTYKHGTTYVDFSTIAGTTGVANGSWVPEYDGTIAITIPTGNTAYVFTESESLYNTLGRKESYSRPNHLDVPTNAEFDALIDTVDANRDDFDFAITIRKNILEYVTKYVGYLYGNETQTKAVNELCDCYDLIDVEANQTYYFKGMWADFCCYKHGSTYVDMTDVWGSGVKNGSWTPEYDGTIALTIPTGSLALFTTSEDLYNSASVESVAIPNHLELSIPHVYHVEKNGSGDFTKISDAVIEATKYMDSVIYLGAGTFDIIDELGADYIDAISYTNRGLYLKNRVHIIGSSNSKITCHYTGTNPTVRAWICIFNSGVYGFTLENVTLEGSNLRYLIHDERDTDADQYINKYLNCYMDFYNEDRSVSSQCIGAGLGLNGEVILDGCIFKSYQSRFPVTFHNSPGANAKSHISVKNCYFDGSYDDTDAGSIKVNYYGQSELVTKVEVCGCSMREAPVSEAEVAGSSPYVNVSIKAWENDIRG